MQRLRHVTRVLAWVHVGLGPVLLVALAVSSPWVVGEGRIEEALKALESVDWRWWVMAAVVLAWGLPIVGVAALVQARKAGLETSRLQQRLEQVLSDRQLPISVDVDTRIPVKVEQALTIPIELATTLRFDEQVDIETAVPLRVDLPLDTTVETSVFGLGTLKVPIHARVPIDLVVPIKGKIRIKTDSLPVHISDQCTARLPEFEVPIHARLETKLGLLDNLRTARHELQKGVKEVLANLEERRRPPDP
ncbi:MAG: hypothetical protein JNJ54_33270 [Myxococcaceae bacterium]|nr:hypothetical protein [Myxococcaceae bacterium]